MAVCNDCSELHTKLSKIQPHPSLDLLNTKKWAGTAMASGVVNTYKCRVCGTELTRDMDKKDAYASWEIKR